MKNQITSKQDLTPQIIENIRTMVNMAGGAKVLAKKCRVPYHNYFNTLRGISSDFAAVNKMTAKARKVLDEKLKMVA